MEKEKMERKVWEKQEMERKIREKEEWYNEILENAMEKETVKERRLRR